jgi:hypothetical protein
VQLDTGKRKNVFALDAVEALKGALSPDEEAPVFALRADSTITT